MTTGSEQPEADWWPDYAPSPEPEPAPESEPARSAAAAERGPFEPWDEPATTRPLPEDDSRSENGHESEQESEQEFVRPPVRIPPPDAAPPPKLAPAVPTILPVDPVNPQPSWRRHENGRWVVGEAGRQSEVVPRRTKGVGKTPADTAVDGASVGRIAYRAASSRGLSHQENGIPRQDAYLVRLTGNDKWLVGAVADGVSSGRLSHLAADLACERLTRTMADELQRVDPDAVSPDWPHFATKQLPWKAAADAAAGAVLAKAEEYLRTTYQRKGDLAALAALPQPLPYPHAQSVMSTTAILFVVATVPDADGAYLAALANVAGDSSAFLLSDRVWTPLTPVKNEGAELAGTAVHPLPDDVEVTPLWGRLQAGQSLVAVSDGVGDPLSTGDGVVGEFLAQQWATPPDLLDFAQQVAFYRRTFTDDRTAVVVWTGID